MKISTYPGKSTKIINDKKSFLCCFIFETTKKATNSEIA